MPVLLRWFALDFDNFGVFEFFVKRFDTLQDYLELPVVSKIINKGHGYPGLKHGLPDADVICRRRLTFHVRMVNVLPNSVAVFELELIEMVEIKTKSVQDLWAKILENH